MQTPASRSSAKLRGISRDTVLLAFSSLFADVSTEMLYPVLPIFLTQVLRASGSIVGLIEGIGGAAQNIVQGFSGWLSDRLQKRKALALAGYFVSALGKPLMGLASVWPEVLGGRFLDRIGAGFRSAPRDALIAGSVPEQYRGQAFGLEGLGDNLGAFLGPLLTVLLYLTFHFHIRWIFYLAVIPGLLAFCLVSLVREPAAPPAAQRKMNTGLRDFPRAYWKYLLAIAVFGLGNSSNSFLILQTQSISTSFVITILIYAGYNLVAALISYPAGWLSDKFGGRNILLGAFVVFFVTYLGFAREHNVVVVGTLFVLYGLFQGTFRAVGKMLATSFAPERLRASGVGWYSTTVGLLGLISSVVAGQLWDRVGHSAVFYFGAASALAGAIALLTLVAVRPAATRRPIAR